MHPCELYEMPQENGSYNKEITKCNSFDKPCYRHADMFRQWTTINGAYENGGGKRDSGARNEVKHGLHRGGSSISAQSSNTYNSNSCKGPRGIIRWARLEEPPFGDDIEDDSKGLGTPGLDEKELWSLHRALPGLRRHDPKTTTIRQHYYPEGGWGWIICGGSFLVQLITNGIQFSCGAIATQIVRKFGQEKQMIAIWICVICLSTSYLLSPLVVAVCRRKSTRLVSIIGGLIMALSCLFSSFATELHQIFLSYGIMLGIGVSMVRETSCLMICQYFKRKRNFVEMVLQTGNGIGVVLFSVFFRQGLSQMGWRNGLQTVTGLTCLASVVGCFYRSASLYHPQRRAILHLKTQRKKVKAKGKPRNDKPQYFDFSVLRYRSLQIILLACGVSSFGIYTPLFYMGLQGEDEGIEEGNILLVQTFFGLAISLGAVITGLVVVRPSSHCTISLQYLCQVTLLGIAVSELAMTALHGYNGYTLFAWMYGYCLGGFQYALPILVLERLRAKNFARAWSFVEGVRFLPVLLGVPIAGYISQSSQRSGYYFSSIFSAIGSLLFFMIGTGKREQEDVPGNLQFTCSQHRASLPGSTSGIYHCDSPQPECTCKDPKGVFHTDEINENHAMCITKEQNLNKFDVFEEHYLDEKFYYKEKPLRRIFSLPKISNVPPPPSPPKVRRTEIMTVSDPDLFTTLNHANRNLVASVSSIEEIIKKDKERPMLRRQHTWHNDLYYPNSRTRDSSVQLIEQITTSV
ncbi:monocarboxylate transporter 2-like isoform X2 [Artemia franciscana]|uniref:Monocarboxylate transporter n=3 Tax=Artemia franciscana TaxID=6661 RepID=A0AA88I1J5_ARTSF|nr:hypothetical protein QYM36_010849 [Artemia franciscana]KAK2716432.1 hypothetical protein QYM36_010849 [Artemia franciscana]